MTSSRKESLGTVFLCMTLISCGVTEALGEPFGNLDFEIAVISSPGTPGTRLASAALPFWTASTGNKVLYEETALDSAAVSVLDGLNYLGAWANPKPLAGNYSLILQDGIAPQSGVVLTSAYISQTGDIPADRRSLMFQSDMTRYINELQVSLNGVVVPFTLYSVGGTVNPSYGPVNTYACDISAFAGDTDVTLKFEKLVHDPLNPSSHGIVDLDNIQFSSTVVPEPSTLALLTIAAVVALAPIVRRRVMGK
jgi:hypothetical protein